MPFKTLITPVALAKCLGEYSAIVIDCRFKLDEPGWGRDAFCASHIPGAVYAHVDRDLSGPKTGKNGRHPLPDIATFAATLGRLGVRNGVQVVAYDQDNGMYASRLWWMLRWVGHDAVAVLDGGFAAWIGENRPTEQGEPAATPSVFTPVPRPEMIVDLPGVAAIATSGSAVLIDARAPQRYRGESETLDPVAGHIPHARNYFFQQNVDERGAFKSPADLRSQLNASLGTTPASSVVCYCGSGVTACHNLLAMEHAGLTGARLYPGSWSEWCADESRGVATGD
jgi:thiosulfate/3-mercaptopyruvate sulfurtransferase